jgi:hypothetical protein
MSSAVKRSIISAAWQILTGELDREVGRNYLAGRDPGRLAAQHVHLPVFGWVRLHARAY